MKFDKGFDDIFRKGLQWDQKEVCALQVIL